MASKVTLEEFVPKSNVKIQVDEDEKEEDNKEPEPDAGVDEIETLNKLLSELDPASIGVAKTDFI